MNLLIIKTGSALPSLVQTHGDFEDWILRGMDLSRDQAVVTDVSQGEDLPETSEWSGIVITGSHDMVTDHKKWMNRTSEWLNGITGSGIPTLGICFGHQLLAHALGGEVGNNLQGGEFGTIGIRLNRKAKTNALFRDLPCEMDVQVSHSQSVIRLPRGAQVLASSTHDPYQAYVIDNHIWGIQFHPEFDEAITKVYIHHHRTDLAQKSVDPDQLIRTCRNTPLGNRILGRFKNIVEKFKKDRDKPSA